MTNPYRGAWDLWRRLSWWLKLPMLVAVYGTLAFVLVRPPFTIGRIVPMLLLAAMLIVTVALSVDQGPD